MDIVLGSSQTYRGTFKDDQKRGFGIYEKKNFEGAVQEMHVG